ncbi:oncostatin-M [Pipistrellus kuhlii]|uniref:Oncostatin M n=1 Tax=Pipistrellus kuhlii TaxID=59472 RepID=A0A7J7UGS9_PIPKU|nr:oncostatin-M [Pipistrellus kuhlii]KAF6312048.1 oncostatin M [Pipistrellus kuhlii]
MWAPPARRTLLILTLRLLFLHPAAPGACPGSSQELLTQLWKLANLMQHPGSLLEPYIQVQGLEESGLAGSCRQRPGAFPGLQELRTLGPRAFLQTLSAQLGPVLRRLAALQQEAPHPAWGEAQRYLLGIRNNIHCLALLLPAPPETPGPPPARPRTPPPPPATPNSFARKLEGCWLLHGFHGFMRAAGQVLGEWRAAPGPRSRRHSPRRALRGGGRRPRGRQPPRRGRRQEPRGQPPR